MKYGDLEFEDHGLKSDGIHTNPIPNLHSHSELELNWIDRGWIEYTTMQGLRLLEAGQLVCFWGAFPHQIMQMSEDAEGYWITVPHEVWLSWELPSTYRQELLSGAFQPLEGVRREQLHLWEQEVGATRATPSLRRAMFLEMEACLLRSANASSSLLSKGRSKTPERGAAGQQHAANLVQLITAHYQEDISIATIAAGAGISPEYAAAVFKETMGISLKSYLTHLRVAHAQSLLLTTSQSITEIGFESGFNTQSRFYAAFQASCGMTPKTYRQRHQI